MQWNVRMGTQRARVYHGIRLPMEKNKQMFVLFTATSQHIGLAWLGARKELEYIHIDSCFVQLIQRILMLSNLNYGSVNGSDRFNRTGHNLLAQFDVQPLPLKGKYRLCAFSLNSPAAYGCCELNDKFFFSRLVLKMVELCASSLCAHIKHAARSHQIAFWEREKRRMRLAHTLLSMYQI